MLPLAVIQEVRQLLDEGQLSQRKIAKRLDISRGTVNAIAAGRRGIYGREPDAENPLPGDAASPAERCLGCGAMVYKPCVLCRARAYCARQELLHHLKSPQRTPHRLVA